MDLYTEQEQKISALESQLDADVTMLEHLKRTNEELMVRAEKAEAENDRLTAALETEKAWWEVVGFQGVWRLTRAMIEQRLEALTAALEGKKA